MKPSIIIVALLTTTLLVQSSDIQLEIGTVLDSKYVWISPKPRNHFRTGRNRNTGQNKFDPFITKVVDGIEYLIAYDKGSHKITYIYTYDREFKTADGLHVGKRLDLKREQVTVNPGWHIYAPKTKDGWQPLIGSNETRSSIEIEGTKHDLLWDVTEGFRKGEIIHVTIWGFVKGGR